MLANLRRTLSRTFRACGVDVRRVGGLRVAPAAGDLFWLQDLEVRSVVDVGACWGQFTRGIRRVLPNVPIVAFEPLPDLHVHLLKFTEGDAGFRSHQVALGDTDGEVDMYRNSFPDSSSLLPMGESHKKMFPFASREHRVRVPLRTLDSFEDVHSLPDPLLLKIDVQGYELPVLRGGDRTLRRAAVVLIETSFEQLYEGQPLFAEVYTHMRDRGFEYAGQAWQLEDPATGRPVQADSIFVRRTRNSKGAEAWVGPPLQS